MITELLTRLRFLVFRKKRSELDDELRFHLEQSIATKVAAGLPVSEARRLALVEFGGVEVTRERCERQRPGWWVGTIAKDLRYSLRGIVVHRWFSAAIIVTLALGIGLNSMVFILVNAVLFKPVPVPGGDRLISINSRSFSKTDRNLPISYPDFQDYRAQATSLSPSRRHRMRPVSWAKAEILPTSTVSSAQPPAFFRWCMRSLCWGAHSCRRTIMLEPKQYSCSATTSGRSGMRLFPASKGTRFA
jgi:hypothetical protein